MKTVLHILTKPDDTLARVLIETQKQMAQATVEVVDLTGARPDYEALVDKIFAADSVAVW